MTQPSEARGTCRQCRHANHETDDAAEGSWACPWLGATGPDTPCRIKYSDTGAYVFEAYDGDNGTWGTGHPIYRSIPAGYASRRVIPADDETTDESLCLLPLAEELPVDDIAQPKQPGWASRLARVFRRLFSR